MRTRTLFLVAVVGLVMAADAAISQTRPSATRPASALTGKIDWGAATTGVRTGQGAVALRFAQRLDRQALDAVALPVLLPGPALAAKAKLVSFPDYYAIVCDAGGAQVELTGTNSFVPVKPGTLAPLLEKGGQPTVIRTVDGQMLSFMRYGVLYTVEITCDRAFSDVRCTRPDYARQVAADAQKNVVMGKAAQKAAQDAATRDAIAAGRFKP
jgi:hypothetical protein